MDVEFTKPKKKKKSKKDKESSETSDVPQPSVEYSEVIVQNSKPSLKGWRVFKLLVILFSSIVYVYFWYVLNTCIFFFCMCIVCYAIVIDVTARLFFFSIKKGSVQVGWDGDGSYIRFKNVFFVLMPVPLVFLLLCLFHHR